MKPIMQTAQEVNITECIIDGKIMQYDACGTGDLKKIKDYYSKHFKYIGSGKIYSVNGFKQDLNNDCEYHFFIKNF